MFDIGVNLLHPQFDADRNAVLARAWQAGVEHLVITGTDLRGSAAAADFIAAAPAPTARRLSCTAGIHPHDAAAAPDGWLDELKALAGRPEVVAVGETGLDFNRDFSPRPVQQALFRAQLQLAADLDLPVFVHDRDAGATVAKCLDACASPAAGVVVHCFTGNRPTLHRYLEMGCYIGITGWLCDRRRGEDLRGLVPEIPLDRLLVETDAPFLKPQNAAKSGPGRSGRNEPALLVWVIRQLATCLGVAEEELAAVTTANARRFFRLPD